MNRDDRHPSTPDLDAPERLVRALAEVGGRTVPVPPERDESVLRLARKHLENSVRRPPPGLKGRVVERLRGWWIGTAAGCSAWPRPLGWAATGALLLVGIWLAVGPSRERTSRRGEDLNGDGRVDIRDALAFARRLEGGDRAVARLDFNRDGTVDGGDVEVVAAQAVALDLGGAP